MSKERRLGRGLEALLGAPLEPVAQVNPELSIAQQPETENHIADESGHKDNGISQIGVYDIDGNPFQPRQQFEEKEIQSLSESITEHGLMQPLLVRRAADRFELISGERRLRAAIKAGWSTVPVQIWEANDQKMTELAIVENLQRKDLNAIEKAVSFQQYLQRYQCTQEDFAKRLNIDRSTIANLIRLLELPVDIQDYIQQGKLTQGHARALLPLDQEKRQLKFAQKIIDAGMSVRNTEEMVQCFLQENSETGKVKSKKAGPKQQRSEHLNSLEQELRLALGTKVNIQQTSSGKGKIVLNFASHEEFERIHSFICGHQQGFQQSEAG